MTRSSAGTSALLVIGLMLSGCNAEDRDAGTAAGTAGAVADVAGADVDTAVPDASPPAGDTAADPFAGFELAADPGVFPEPRRLALRMRNDGSAPVVVRADGGAGDVLLDTVPENADRRIDLLTRARVVRLTAAATDGRVLRSVEVTVGPDTVVAVAVGPTAP